MDRYRQPVRPLLWFGLFALLYAMLFCAIGLRKMPGEALSSRDGLLTGRVFACTNSYVLIKDSVFLSGSEELRAGGVRLWNSSPSSIRKGQTIAANVALRPITNNANPGAFDTRRYLFSKGVDYEAEGELLAVSGEEDGLAALRFRLLQRVRQLWPEDEGILQALLLGWDETNEALEQSYRAAGVAHVLAVSGLHVGFVAAMLSCLLSFLPKNSLPRFLFLCAGLAAYCLLTGASASTQRACLMAALLFLARVLGRETDGLSSLSLSFGCMLLLSPRQLLDTGFQLSFSAMLGIVLLYPRVQRALKFLPPQIRSACALTLAAQAGCLPVLLCRFGSMSPYSPLANLLAVSLAGLAVPLGLLTLLLDLLLPGAAQLPLVLCRLCVSCMNLCASAVSSLPYAQLFLPKLPAPLLLFWPALLLFLCEGKKRTRKMGAILSGALCLATLLVWICGLYPRDPELTFLSVGCADSAILRHRGTTVVIDAGRTGYDTLSALQAEGPSVDALILTHADADHSGGAKRLLDGAHVRCLCYPKGMEADEDIAPLLALAKSRGCALRAVAAGDALRYDTLVFSVLSPEEYRTEHSNEDSLALRLSCGETSVFLPGDTGQKTLSSLDLTKADVVKLPHHGSRDGLTAEQLRALSPSQTVLSVGANPYGLPSAQTLSLLGDIPLARTDMDGAVRLVFRDGAFCVLRYKQQPERFR